MYIHANSVIIYHQHFNFFFVLLFPNFHKKTVKDTVITPLFKHDVPLGKTDITYLHK